MKTKLMEGKSSEGDTLINRLLALGEKKVTIVKALKILSKKIIPEMIITEFNPSFLDNEITVPYDKSFNFHKKHPSLWYHGASLSAFNKLLVKYNFSLVKVIDGVNAVFVDENLLKTGKSLMFSLKKCWLSIILGATESKHFGVCVCDFGVEF